MSRNTKVLIGCGGAVGFVFVLFIGLAALGAVIDLLDGTSDEPSKSKQAGSGDSARGSGQDRQDGRGSRDANAQGDGDRNRTDAGQCCVVVTRVIDGDTVEAEKLGTVRLIGVDTPEEGRCYDNAATRYTEGRLGGQRVGYEIGAEDKDRYGRTLAYLYRGREMYNLDLVDQGYASVLTIPPNDKYADRFEAAEQSAKQQSEGRWGTCDHARPSVNAKSKPKPRPPNRPRKRHFGGGGGGGGSGGGGVPSLSGPGCLPQSACPGRADGDGDGCYCE